MKAKILSFGLILLLGVSMMAMAGGGGQSTPAPSSGQSALNPSRPITITVWSNDAHNKAQFDALVAQYNNGPGRLKGVRIEYTVYGADWQTAMAMAMETNREPDMFKTFNNFEAFQAAGRFLPWTEIKGIEDILAKQAPYHRQNSSLFDGVPYSVCLYGWWSGLHYNKELLQRAGFSAPPKTWAEFEQMVIAINRLGPNIYGYAMPLVWNPDFCHWMTEYFYTPVIGHMYWNFTEGRYMFEAFTPYFEMLARIREAGAMFPGMETLSDDMQRAQFAAGNIGFIGGAGWNVGVLYDQFPFGGADATGAPLNPTGWDYAPMPEQNFAVPVSASASYLVSAQVRNNPAKMEAMADVINLFCGDETQMLMFSTGMHIPLRDDLIAISTPSDRPQWTSFGASADRMVTMSSAPTGRLTIEGPDRAVVIGQILTGQIPISGIRAALEDLSRRHNAAFEQAVARGIITREAYIDPTFEARLRGN